MKVRNFNLGTISVRAYFKCVGRGWETGIEVNSTNVFVGNFINMKDAVRWYREMLTEIENFARKFALSETHPVSWYRHFVRNYFYKEYFAFTTRANSVHGRHFARATRKDSQTYRKLKAGKSRLQSVRSPYYKAA